MSFLRVRRGGFTLIELMVVIAIITVLIAIGLPVMTRVREKTRQTACIANLHQLQTALRLYRLDEGGYPGPYDPVTGEGGLNALYPTYVPSRKVFICPDDPVEDGRAYATQRPYWLKKEVIAPDDPNLLEKTLLARAGQMYYQQPEPPAAPVYRGYPWLDFNFKTKTYVETEASRTFFAERYSSYNLYYNWLGFVWWDPDPSQKNPYFTESGLQVLPGGTASPQAVWWGDSVAYWYTWLRWDPENLLGINNAIGLPTSAQSQTRDFVDKGLHYFLAQQVYWQYYPKTDIPVYPKRPKDPVLGGLRYPLQDSLKRDLWSVASEEDSDPYGIGLPSGVFPGLINRNAPENTIVTRCMWHRPFTNAGLDVVLRLDGTAETIPAQFYQDRNNRYTVKQEYNWAVQPRIGQ